MSYEPSYTFDWSASLLLSTGDASSSTSSPPKRRASAVEEYDFDSLDNTVLELRSLMDVRYPKRRRVASSGSDHTDTDTDEVIVSQVATIALEDSLLFGTASEQVEPFWLMHPQQTFSIDDRSDDEDKPNPRLVEASVAGVPRNTGPNSPRKQHRCRPSRTNSYPSRPASGASSSSSLR